MEITPKPRSFGLVAGLGVGAGIFYYKALVDAHLARGLSPRLLMVHADVRYVGAQGAARNTKRLAEYLAGLLNQLALGGAEIATIPAFAPQICADELEAITPATSLWRLEPLAATIRSDSLPGHAGEQSGRKGKPAGQPSLRFPRLVAGLPFCRDPARENSASKLSEDRRNICWFQGRG